MDRAAYDNMLDLQTAHWWYRARRDILNAVLQQLSLPANARILEIGCGSGGNLKMLARYGSLTAVEMDEESLQHARTVNTPAIGADLKQGYLPHHLPLGEDERFDLICLFDVLEHVEQDVEALATLRRLLTPNGQLLLTVPALQWLYGKHDRWFHHFRRYGRGELKSKLEQQGFAVRRLHFFNFFLFPLAVAARLLDHRRSGDQSLGTTIPAAPLNGLLYRVFQVERHWLKRHGFPVGISLLALATPANRSS